MKLIKGKSMKFLFFTLTVIGLNVHAETKKICGEDNRNHSFENEVGRASSKGLLAGCTVTMISPRCGIGAGHCVDDMEIVQFNVPFSENSNPNPSDQSDIYLRNKDFLRYANNGVGDDWSVILLNANQKTNRFPGDVQGYLAIDNGVINLEDKIKVVGFGENLSQAHLNLAQQSSEGVIKKIGGGFFGRKSIIGYDADTTIGSSGAPVINLSNNKIIGIHTDGSCVRKEFNQGTLVSKNKVLLQAIQQCLDFEKASF